MNLAQAWPAASSKACTPPIASPAITFRGGAEPDRLLYLLRPAGRAMPMWMNDGEAGYRGLTAAFRRQFSNSLQLDFNYTLRHSIDNGSASEAGAEEEGASAAGEHDSILAARSRYPLRPCGMTATAIL